ncbi:MAG TPA: uracil-DNA glycosylase [Bryobacterales bacterium]|nr:uracil-DNA glycosylase [Bryobacterales bacterium]
MTSQQIRQYLRFYRDLGFEELYRREAPAAPAPAPPAAASRPAPQPAAAMDAPPLTGPADLFAAVASEAPREALEQIQADLGDCTRCRLHQRRTHIVFGVGSPQAKLVFVGEGPGADEDAQGIPFVGRAGQLLTQMIENTAAREGLPLKRADVYICNVVKCRPPENRTPERDEMDTCSPFLFRQIESIRPRAICVLGGTAAKALLATTAGITQLRGKWQSWRGIPVMPTYHPSFLLRGFNAAYKKEAWEDLKKVLHYVYG